VQLSANTPTVIKITKGQVAQNPGATSANWLNKNWPWVMAGGIGLLLLTFAQGSKTQ